jgi:hypothetical protein
MALHLDLPVSPSVPLLSKQRWFPANKELRSTAVEQAVTESKGGMHLPSAPFHRYATL